MTTQYKAEDVRRYYDENTRLFLSLGQGSEGTIHRAIWGPGVTNRREAMAYADSLVAARIQELGAESHVVDLGCGVCASLCRLAGLLPIRGTGVTISAKQVELARDRIAAAGLSERLRCEQADFCNLPSNLEPADLAFGVESFVHAARAEDFFRECGKLVRTGGKLIVCDDFLGDAKFDLDPHARRWLDKFRQGWVASNVIDLPRAEGIAAQHGFVSREVVDLSSMLEMRRPRDIAVGLGVHLFGWLPYRSSYLGMLEGGYALQRGLRRGWLKHLFVVWEKQ